MLSYEILCLFSTLSAGILCHYSPHASVRSFYFILFIDDSMSRLYNVRILFLDTHVFIKLFVWHPYFAPNFCMHNTFLSLSYSYFVILCLLLPSCVYPCVFQIWLTIVMTGVNSLPAVYSSCLHLCVPLSTEFYILSIKSITFHKVF